MANHHSDHESVCLTHTHTHTPSYSGQTESGAAGKKKMPSAWALPQPFRSKFGCRWGMGVETAGLPLPDTQNVWDRSGVVLPSEGAGKLPKTPSFLPQPTKLKSLRQTPLAIS